MNPNLSVRVLRRNSDNPFPVLFVGRLVNARATHSLARTRNERYMLNDQPGKALKAVIRASGFDSQKVTK